MASLAAGARPPEAPQVIQPSEGLAGLELRELWRYRELLYFLVWRNVLVRYKQTALGIAWALLQPLFLLVVFTVVFGHVAKLGSDGLPYALFAYAALVPWTFFSNALTQSSNSLVGSANLLTKVYFPRLSLPLAAVLGAIVDFLVSFTILLGMMVYWERWPRVEAIGVLPALLLLGAATALGVGLWLSALNVAYRDIQYATPFLVQVWLYVTPIIWPLSSLGEPWRTLVGLNPMAGVVVGFRWALVGSPTAPGWTVGVGAVVAVALLASGAVFFRRRERTFADIV
jgi:lipopolysaccharide transport system permease protein